MNKPQLINFDAGAPVVPALEPTDHDQDELSIRTVLQVLVVRRWTILGTIIAAMAVATLILSQLTPIYSATTLLMIGERQNKALDVDSILAGLSTDAAAIENQLQVLKSPAIAARVIAKLKLERDLEFKGTLAGGQAWLDFNPLNWFHPDTGGRQAAAAPDDPAIVKALLSRLSATAQGRSSVIKVSFESPDAPKSALVVNALPTNTSSINSRRSLKPPNARQAG
jgi:uncharacterized protein involved in exopolysaccharide biosynthesis